MTRQTRRQLDCRSCRYSYASPVCVALYCSLTSARAKQRCTHFEYEPGTDVDEWDVETAGEGEV